MSLKNKLGKQLLFFEGAMGTMLQQRGLPAGEISEHWNVEMPHVIEDIHSQYLAAGCNILKTNTFGGNSLKYEERKYDHRELIRQGIAIAKKAIQKQDQRKQHESYLCLCMGPTGKLLEPLGKVSFEEAYRAYKEMVEIGVKEGIDGILIETITDTYELKAAVLAAKENSQLPVFASVTPDEKGQLLTGGSITTVVALLEGLNVDAIGLNCGFGPDQLMPFLEDMANISSTPIFFNPNAGLPSLENGETVFNMPPEAFVEAMRKAKALNPYMVGGCCGTTPAHLELLVRSFFSFIPQPVLEKNNTYITSYATVVDIADGPKIIGEKINPTGNKAVSQALQKTDLRFLGDLSSSQKRAGAHVIGVNVGLPQIDEESMMKTVIKYLQSNLTAPLMIDTSNSTAMEKAARLYNGKPLLNSVNGKEDSLNSVLPIAAKYGGVLVALTLDDDGIPNTPRGRAEIARKIIDRAAEYGIKKKDILVDPLTMTISSGSENANITLETLRILKEELEVGTIMGVSNISFGLPNREIITSAFYTNTLKAGLDAAIMNPFSQSMMDAYYAHNALAGNDSNCLDYIEYTESRVVVPLNTSTPTSKTTAASASSATNEPNPSTPINAAADDPKAIHSKLSQLIIGGERESIKAQVLEMLKEIPPMEIINGHIIPALNETGDRFEDGSFFLPQLIMSGEAATTAFEILKTEIASMGGESKGRIILATVKGDIHDIGKNIVKVMLESYGYQVIDLGKDTPPQLIVDTAISENVALVGLSALMTTTLPSMHETISLLRASNCHCKVVVGGAVLTEEYAKDIGADHYGRDAMSTVRYAGKIFEAMS